MSKDSEKYPAKESPESNRERIKSQLKHPDKIELYEGGTMDVVDVKPERPKTEIPTFWLRGWGTTVEVHEDNIVNLAERGRRTLAVDAPHGIESANIQELTTEREQEIHDIELRKVAALLKSLDEKGIEQTDIVAHSEGAIYGVLAALLRPEKFRNMVLVDPAGMVGEDTKGRLVKGVALDIGLQIARIYKKLLTKEGFEAFKQSSTAAKALVEVFASNPRHTVESIGVIAETQIHEILQTLKELGIKISIVHGVDDKFFPMERVQQQTTTEMVDGFYSVNGTHNQLYLHPEKYTALIDTALDALEALWQKENNNNGKSNARREFEKLREKMIRKEKRYLPEEFLVKINNIIHNYFYVGLKDNDIDKEESDLENEDEKYFTEYRQLVEDNKELIRKKQMWVLHEILQNFIQWRK